MPFTELAEQSAIYAQEIITLRAQRDQLLAAPESIVNHKEFENPLSGHRVLQARAAIAKVKGGDQ